MGYSVFRGGRISIDSGTSSLCYNDTEKTTTNTTYTKLSSISVIFEVVKRAQITYAWEQKSSSTLKITYVKPYRNGVAVGNEYQRGATSYGYFTDTVTFTDLEKGDTLELYGAVDSGGTCYLRRFQILGSAYYAPFLEGD